MSQTLSDDRDRRKGIDRREIFYTMHILERRSGKERRNGDYKKRKSRTSNNNKDFKRAGSVMALPFLISNL